MWSFKNRWHLGGGYRYEKSVYPQKSSILSPLYPTPSKPTLLTPVIEKTNPTF